MSLPVFRLFCRRRSNRAEELHSRYYEECEYLKVKRKVFVPSSFKKGGTHMEDYNDDVYLEPTVELSSDTASAVGQAQEVKVVICESGC